MKRLLSGMVPLLALLIGVSCSTEPTADLRNGVDRLLATPSQLFLELGASKTVEVTGVDAQGNPQSLTYEVTAVGTGITVKRDSSFRPNFVNDSTPQVPSEAPTFRFIVTATNYAATSFTVSAGGKSTDIKVQVVPQNQIAATLSNATPALGDTVTVTAAPGTTFADTARLFFGDTLHLATIVERDPNGQFIRFIPPPSVNSPVGITAVTSVSAPGLVFSPVTSTILTTPLIDTVGVSYSTTTPALGQTVTMAIVQDPAHIKFATVDSIIYPGLLPGPAAGPAAITVAADSTSLTFQAPPNAAGSGTVVSFVFPGGYLIPLPTRPTLTSANIGTTVNATFSDSTPDLLTPVTITLPAAFKVGTADTTLTVVFGDKPAIIQSVGGGGSTITVIPLPGSAATATITPIFPIAAPQFLLSLATVASITVPALTPLTGTDAAATAPALTIPGAGSSTTLNDAGTFTGPSDCCFGGPTRLYKFTLAAPTTLTFTLDWFEGQDLGVYITQSDAVTLIAAGDNGGEGPTGHPETVTVTLAAGTYFAAIPNFSATDPSFFQLKISNP